MEAALREWKEETGIPQEQLHAQPGAYLDEGDIGCRYLVARVEPVGFKEGESSWAPPCEDPTDSDPIALAHWVPVHRVLGRDRFGLSGKRATLLRSALQILGLQVRRNAIHF